MTLSAIFGGGDVKQKNERGVFRNLNLFGIAQLRSSLLYDVAQAKA